MLSSSAAAVILSTFLTSLLCTPPLILQLKARNIALSSLIASVLLANSLHFINASIWHQEDAIDSWHGQILCDIEIKLRVGLDMVLPGSIACVFRQLSSIIVSTQYSAGQPRRCGVQKRNTYIFEATLCSILPILRMTLSYVVQPDRYRVSGIYGCESTVDSSWPSYALVLAWPPAVCLVGLWYAALASLRMTQHSREVASLLPGGQIGANQKRTWKLFCMTLVLFLLDAPSRGIIFWKNMFLNPTTYSWSEVHPPDWTQRIQMAPFNQQHWIVYAASMVHAMVVFIFFGCGREATAMYKFWLDRPRLVLEWCTSKPPQPSKTTSLGLPITSDNREVSRDAVHELAAI